MVVGTDWPNVDRHTLPGRIEQFVSIKKSRDARFALARKKLQKRGQILRANDLARKRPVEEVETSRRVMVTCRLE